MCISPSAVWVKRGPKWVETPRPCDRCWSCRENYVSDWVGRCLCEAATSQVACTLSLTYATPRDVNDLSHRVVNPHHFQLFIKRLRNAGHKVRYLVAGEYGDLKSRAHFHVILFFSVLKDVQQVDPHLMDRVAFQDDPSIASKFSRQMPNKSMCHIAEWPHGHVECDWSMDEKAVRYCTEYLYEDGKKTGWSSMSKKPPLGFAWFAEKARTAVDLEVFPNSFEYLPPGGKPGKKYLMTGATRRDFLNLITLDRADRPKMSKWVKASFDKFERQEFIKGRTAAGFDEERFLDRQMSPEKQASLLVWQEGLQKLSDERFMKLQAEAWGFDDVEEFEAFAESGGCEAFPDRFRGFKHVQGRDGDPGTTSAPVDGWSAARGAIRSPDWFDRHGRPQWGPEGREYLAGAFAREGQGQTGQSDPSGGLQEDASQE